jgi:hypothetical protein
MNEKEKKLNDMLDKLNDKLDKALALKARQKMGMSIDKAIIYGEEQLEIFGGEHKEFIEIATEIMRKYKQINDIVMNSDEVHYRKLMFIREIIENENRGEK